MSKVYVVTSGSEDYGDYQICQVFLNKRLAQKYINMKTKWCGWRRDYLTLEEYEDIDEKNFQKIKLYHFINFRVDCDFRCRIIEFENEICEPNEYLESKVYRFMPNTCFVDAELWDEADDVFENIEDSQIKFEKYLEDLSKELKYHCRDIPENNIEERMKSIERYLKVKFKI